LASKNKVDGSDRDCECTSSINVRIRKRTVSVFEKHPDAAKGFLCEVYLQDQHNHEMDNLTANRFHRPNTETQNIFFDFFKNGSIFLNALLIILTNIFLRVICSRGGKRA
jgi:hypothetical protein